MRHLLIVAFLLLAGCGAHPTDPMGRAAATGDLSTLERLAGDASREALDSGLMWAARFGQPGAIAYLVRRGADPNARRGVNDWSMLEHAIHRKQPAAVQALLAAGADVNARGSHGRTALMMAAGYGYTEIVRILLARGADARASAVHGETAVDLATHGVFDIDRMTWGSCQSETVRALLEAAPDVRPRSAGKCR
jgi:ankyrin repeat protein